MANIDKISVRDEVGKVKEEFEKLQQAGKVSPEIAALMRSMLMIMELILAIFLERKTKKNNRNSSLPSSQTEKDESTVKTSGSNTKGKLENSTTATNSLKHMQQNLVRSERLAALGNMVVGIAPEINTPLGIGVTEISHLADKLQEIHSLHEQEQLSKNKFQGFLKLSEECSDSILRNLRRCAQLIDSFKLVAVDQMTLDQRRFNLKDCLIDVILSLKSKLKRTNHSILIDCACGISINSYPGAFSQIITILVINSLIHAFDAEQHGIIEIKIKNQTQMLHINYQDNGKGMEASVLKQIFDPFFTTKRGQGGTGLGMHIVYNLVTQKLKGNIECISSPGKGVSFTISIPLNQYA